MFRLTRGAALTGLAVALAACGGGGGTVATVSTVPPAPAPAPSPPTSTPPVTIFAAPVPGEYVSVGASTSDNLSRSTSARIQSISLSEADLPRIRYSSAGYYEIQMPGREWDRLTHYKGIGNPDSGNNYFQPASVPMNYGYLVISKARDSGYKYSELGTWGNLNLSLEGGYGAVAFGVPTPAGAVPVSGSATYSGKISGTTDVLEYDNLYGGTFSHGAGGTVSLVFDFRAASLSGLMDLMIDGGMNPVAVGTYRFRDTVFGAGATTYSGKFETNLPGAANFLGRFTGPNAEETIGAWTVPFVEPATGQVHTAIGAWIAKRP